MKTKHKNSLMKASVLSAIVLALSIGFIPSVVAYSTEQTEEVILEETADPAVFEKTEVVYATLTPEGSAKGIYVVNQFDVQQAGEIVDFGPYATVSNLTDQAAIDFSDEEAVFNAGEGAFYYQGNVAVDGAKLPWDVHLSYTLDGAAVSPDELAGESGALSVHVTTTPAAGVDQSFYKSYMLQISFTLNGDTTADIVAEGATVASAGRNRTVAFTVLPGRNADCVLSANVTGFEMSGVQIAALPYSMAMEMPDTSGLAGQMQELSDAISEMDAGIADLAAGSAAFGDGLALAAEKGGLLVSGSESISSNLNELAAGLEQGNTSIASELKTVAGYLRMMSDSMTTYQAALGVLPKLVGVLPAAMSITSTEAEELYDLANNSGSPTAAQAAGKVLNLASSVEGSGLSMHDLQALASLADLNNDERSFDPKALVTMANGLDTIAVNLSSEDPDKETIAYAVDGLKALAYQYDTAVHPGIALYVGGISELNANYALINEGTQELAGGVSQLNQATINIPAAMRAEIEAMMADYEFPEFDPISFVDSRNDANMTAVQFVLTTEAIEVPEPETVEDVEEEQTIVDRFFALFQ